MLQAKIFCPLGRGLQSATDAAYLAKLLHDLSASIQKMG